MAVGPSEAVEDVRRCKLSCREGLWVGPICKDEHRNGDYRILFRSCEINFEPPHQGRKFSAVLILIQRAIFYQEISIYNLTVSYFRYIKKMIYFVNLTGAENVASVSLMNLSMLDRHISRARDRHQKEHSVPRRRRPRVPLQQQRLRPIRAGLYVVSI